MVRVMASLTVWVFFTAWALAGMTAASGAVLEVGAGKAFASPSEAIARAKDGDTVRVSPGVYVDCATIRQHRLILEGAGGEVVMRDKTCAGKAILVIQGTKVTVRGLTLTNARVPDKNGAGIRAEGDGLRVENTTFLNNENGILGANDSNATLTVVGSTFIGNGHCQPTCAHGIYAGHAKLLRVERSRFFNQREGHHIKSRALRTEVIGCDIQDGPEGTASYLIDIPNGGSVLIEKNQLRKGPRSSNKSYTITIGVEGNTNPPGPIVVTDNNFINELGRFTVFVRNETGSAARLSGNIVTGSVKSLEGPGTVSR